MGILWAQQKNSGANHKLIHIFTKESFFLRRPPKRQPQTAPQHFYEFLDSFT